MEKYLLVSKKTILLFLFSFLCTAGAFAQYHKGGIGDRTKQGVTKIHQRNVNAGKRISKRMTERRQAQEKGRCKQNFKFKDLTIVASYDNYQRKSNLYADLLVLFFDYEYLSILLSYSYLIS